MDTCSWLPDGPRKPCSQPVLVGGLGTECNLPTPHCQALDQGLGSAGQATVAKRCHLGSPPAPARKGMDRQRSHASSPMHRHPGAPAWQRHFTGQAPGSEPPTQQSPLPADHMFRHTDAAAPEGIGCRALLEFFDGWRVIQALFGGSGYPQTTR